MALAAAGAKQFIIGFVHVQGNSLLKLDGFNCKFWSKYFFWFQNLQPGVLSLYMIYGDGFCLKDFIFYLV